MSDEPTDSGYVCAYLTANQFSIAPCNKACPAGEKIQPYIDLLNCGLTKANLRAAWELLTEDNPFPSICGRVCFHPCEQSCNRIDYDQPIGIHNIERFIGDNALRESFKWKFPKFNKRFNIRGSFTASYTTRSRTASSIAVVGGGPAGLSCAYHLRRKGYHSTIYEAGNELGGLLTRGIPAYRLPLSIARAEIKRITNTGISIRLNTSVGKDIDFSQLQKQYQVIFVAVGAHHERKLNVPGEEHPSVIPSSSFLNDLSHGKKAKLGRTIGIIGGGNAAIDAARIVLRLGSKPIIIYRRIEAEMPAIRDEVLEAKEEGITFLFLSAPIKIVIQKNKITAIECVKMKLGQRDKSGRRTPLPIKGSNFRIKLDTIIPAIGEETDISFLPDSCRDGNRIKMLADGISTDINGVFAGGDAATGPKSVVEAIGAGKKAANAIISYLNKEKNVVPVQPQSILFDDLNISHFEHKSLVNPDKLLLSRRKQSFVEVYKGYNNNKATEETARCFACGSCRTCLECEMHCPDMAIEVRSQT